jgi:hypothetical protein
VNWPRTLHAASASAVSFAVPLAVYRVNGTFEPAAAVLGIVIGFCWWYFFPFSLP